MRSDRILPGVMWMLGFCVTAPLIDVAAKLAAASLPAGQVTAARFVVQGALMLPAVLWMGLPLRPARAALPMLALRALFLILSTFTFVSAVAVMPVADALAIAFVEPFFLLLLGRFLFGEAVGPRRIGACLAGFGGALLVIQPSLAAFGPVALWPLGTAVAFAAYMLVTRHLSATVDPVSMQLHTATLATAMCLPVLWLAEGTGWTAFDPRMPEGLSWLWLAGVGSAAALSHMLMTQALRLAPSATLAPLHYLEIVAAVALGYWIFGDFPDAMAWAGIAVICAAGLLVVARERRVARAARPATAD